MTPKRINQILLLLLCTASITLSGCGFIPGVYKIDVQQGNVVTQDMVDQLRPGMTQRQVRFIMGTPLLQDTFHPDRWDYLYSMKSGRSDREQERISLNFEDNKLVGLSGDFVPGTSTDDEIMSGEQNSDTESYPVDLGAPLGTGE
ncbi:MAG TPA: outer membrane protein assembly factor BamE [Pseudomonas sabulinigri]|uniref:Outer membrane protein assembly factor BamE domain-containing protein n=1 Tax=marine sediment metagenome TaxID=412755 RepID=A0A0F9V3V6_9ZZZZ|nr:outer membrane protein assembly factor BamE [Halopseudomonas sabulinigri]HEC51462.1 outer membrane protein assembly factor BamE [Halopseudomonas sabulinigri]